jgi:hypothetical protein
MIETEASFSLIPPGANPALPQNLASRLPTTCSFHHLVVIAVAIEGFNRIAEAYQNCMSGMFSWRLRETL